MCERLPALSLETVTDAHAVPGAEVGDWFLAGSWLLDTFMCDCGPSVCYQFPVPPPMGSVETSLMFTGGRDHTGRQPHGCCATQEATPGQVTDFQSGDL